MSKVVFRSCNVPSAHNLAFVKRFFALAVLKVMFEPIVWVVLPEAPALEPLLIVQHGAQDSDVSHFWAPKRSEIVKPGA